MSRDYYEVLGVARNATDAEIKRAFREAARRSHPDGNPDDPSAEDRFKEISVAYETLSDPERRRRYDMFGETARPGAGGGQPGGAGGDAFGFGDIFDSFFGGGGDPFGRRGPAGPTRGADLEVLVELTLHQAAFGDTIPIEVRLPVGCSTCDGSGCESGTHPSTCEACGGSGEVRQVRRSILGQMMTSSPCGVCNGTGRQILSPCPTCRGDGRVQDERTIEIEVPAGVDDGQRLRLSGRGGAAPRGGPSGDLYVSLRVASHPDFERRGDDLLASLHLSAAQAALGTVIEVPTLDGAEELTVPPGTQPGQIFRVKGAGVPSLRGRGRGHLLVQADVEVPSRMGEEETALWHQIAELRGEAVSAPDKGVLSRLRSALK